jgi:hypothetical protein
LCTYDIVVLCISESFKQLVFGVWAGVDELNDFLEQ